MNVKQLFAPRSRRDYLLAHSDDPLLRRVYYVRHATGWLLAIVTIVFALFNMQLLTPESIRNIRSSIEAASKVSAGDSTVISYSNGAPDNVIPFGSGLAVCSDDMLSIELPGNYTQMETPLAYATPALRASSQYLLVFDRNAYRFTVTNTLAELYSKTVSSPITNADIADNGSVAVVTDEAGYKSAVAVYNTANEQLYKWSTADYYIMSAVLSSDGQRLAIFCFKQEGLELKSTLFFTDIDVGENPTDGIDMGDTLALGMRFIGNNTLCVVGDNAAYVVSRSGQVKYSTEYASDALIGFDISDNAVVLATQSYSQSSRCAVTLVNSRGTAARTPLELSAVPDSISYNNDRLAVLTDDVVTFYSKNLRQIDRQDNLAGISRLYMRDDNTAIARMGSHARVLTIGQPLETGE